MAVMRHSIIFGGVDSADYGIYISGEGVFNAPRRDVEMTVIPGRNGALSLDHGRYENISVTYPAFNYEPDYDTFAQNLSDFRNAICSQVGYQRLEDTFHPGEYRMAAYTDGLEVDPIKYNTASQFDLTFNCKPQRFLTSGEEPEDYVHGQAPVDEQTKTGAIVTFEAEEDTIISDLVTDIEPVQNLHGYDKPWSGGNGKNKLNCRVSRLKTLNTGGSWNGNVYTFRGITWTVQSVDGDVVDNVVANGTASGGTGYLIVGSLSDWSMQEGNTYILSNGANTGTAGFYNGSSSSLNNLSIQFTYSGWTGSSNVTIGIANGATANTVVFQPMIRLASESDASFAPYSNICPISGWDEVNVTRTGKNLFDPTNVYNGHINQSAQTINELSNARTVYIKCKPNTTYTISKTAGQRFIVAETKEIPSDRLNVFNLSPHPTSSSITYTTSADANYLCAFVWLATADTITAEQMLASVQIEFGSTATAYEPFGNTYTIDLDGTRYGGTLDVTNGVLTVNRASMVFDGSSDENWQWEGGSVNRGSIQLQNANTGESARMPYLCNRGEYSRFGVTPGITFIYGAIGVLFYYAPVTSLADFKTWLSNNPLQAVFKLATPITVQLTPTEVKTLLGMNNIWADSGNITVKYGTNPYVIMNPTPFDALPLLKVTGAGQLSIGDYIITITGTAGQVIYIDCETMEIYKNTEGVITPASSLVSFATNEFPKLPSGVSGVSLGEGITEVEITPRWWII